MRTNIEIDDTLMRETLELSGLRTKREVVERALQRYRRSLAMDRLLDLEGKVDFWPGYDPEEGEQPPEDWG